MNKLLPLVAAVSATLIWTPRARACECERVWQETVTILWQGQVLEPLQTDALTCPELRYLRNIPYARHGFSFGDNWVRTQFVDDTRYQEDAYVTSETVGPMLTPNDRLNVDMIVSSEEGMQCKAWWDKNGENPAGWNFNEFEEEVIVTEPAYARVEIVTLPVIGGDGGTVTIVAGEATPQFLITRALEAKEIEDEWLAPLTCEELNRVQDALYARHLVDFEDPADEAFFAAAMTGVYTPVPDLTREGAEHFFTSRDKLTLLRANRQQREKGCQGTP